MPGAGVDGCAFEIAARKCDVPQLSGQLGPTETCVEVALADRRRPQSGDRSAAVDLGCELSDRSRHVCAFAAEAPAYVAEAFTPFEPVADFEHHGTGRLLLDSDKLKTGDVTDLAVVGQSLVASWQGGQEVNSNFGVPLAASGLWFFDPSSMERLRTRTITPALRLAVGGRVPALYGLGVRGERFALLELDDFGREIAHVNLGVAWLKPNAESADSPFDLLAEPSFSRLVP